MTMRGHKVFKGLFVSMLLTLTIALGGCAGDKEDGSSTTVTEENTQVSEQTTPVVESKITIGIPEDLDSLDPSYAVAAGTKEILFNVYEGLYKPDSEGNLVPAVASDYSVSEDGLVYTFTLREGVKFHNGNPVTIEDVDFSMKKLANADGEAPLVRAFSNVTDITVVDDTHIALTLEKANADFLSMISTVECAIVPADVADLATTPVGTGPYMLVSRELNDNVVLKKFDAYWGEAAHIEDVTLKIIADGDAITMNLLGGAIDLFSRVTTAQASELNDNFYVEEGAMNLVQAMFLNHEFEPFSNEKVRQALCYAVDKQEIMDFMADGKGTAISSNIFPGFGKYYTPELNDTYKQDIEKAKELLAEAGYPDGFEFTVKVPSNYQQHIDTATVLAEQLKQINVTANIELIEWSAWKSDVYAGRQFEATVVGLDASNLSAGALLARFESTNSKNFTNYANEAYDEAYQNAVNAKSDEEATGYYKECEKILCDTAANVYIQDMAHLVAINKKYAGFTFYPVYVMDIAKLYIVE